MGGKKVRPTERERIAIQAFACEYRKGYGPVSITLGHAPDGEVCIHASEGPAIVMEDGGRIWRQRGVPYRDHDLPTAEFSDGSKFWWANHQPGILSRTTGPAEIGPGGKTWRWFLKGASQWLAMGILEADIRGGGRVLEFVGDAAAAPADQEVVVRTTNIDGTGPLDYVIPCRGWATWMLENKHLIPELDAALLAMSMRARLNASPVIAAPPARRLSNRPAVP